MLITAPDLAKRRTLALIRIPTASPQPRLSVSGKPNFAARDRGGKMAVSIERRLAETSLVVGLALTAW
jgi:hypothetical protein